MKIGKGLETVECRTVYVSCPINNDILGWDLEGVNKICKHVGLFRRRYLKILPYICWSHYVRNLDVLEREMNLMYQTRASFLSAVFLQFLKNCLYFLSLYNICIITILSRQGPDIHSQIPSDEFISVHLAFNVLSVTNSPSLFVSLYFNDITNIFLFYFYFKILGRNLIVSLILLIISPYAR